MYTVYEHSQKLPDFCMYMSILKSIPNFGMYMTMLMSIPDFGSSLIIVNQ